MKHSQAKDSSQSVCTEAEGAGGGEKGKGRREGGGCFSMICGFGSNSCNNAPGK